MHTYMCTGTHTHTKRYIYANTGTHRPRHPKTHTYAHTCAQTHMDTFSEQLQHHRAELISSPHWVSRDKATHMPLFDLLLIVYYSIFSVSPLFHVLKDIFIPLFDKKGHGKSCSGRFCSVRSLLTADLDGVRSCRMGDQLLSVDTG